MRRQSMLAAATAAALGLPTLVVVASCHGCGTGEDGGSSSVQTDAAADSDSTVDVVLDRDVQLDASVDADADVLDAGPLRDGVPAGWDVWTEWSDNCPMYVPGPGAEMPPPIEWEPCSAAVPSYLECRRMRDFWSGGGLGIAGYPNFTLDPATGKALLQFTRIRVGGDKNVSHKLVAEADGVVRDAFLKLDTQSLDCRYAEEDVYGDRFAQYIHTKTGPVTPNGTGEEWGLLGGPIDVTPPAVVHRPDDPTRPSNWYVSDQWVVQLVDGRHQAHSWDFAESHIVYRAGEDPDGLPPYKATLVGGDVFSELSSGNRCGVMSWSLEHGSRPLLRWFGDSTHGANNFATDGKDMVWTYSAGPQGCGVDASNPEVWTAPYTTDPAEVATTARRVRKDVFGMSPYSYAVGFGYAMRTTGSSDLFVVRLSDGAATLLPREADVLSWLDVLGVTTDEIFVEAHMKADMAGITIARIPIANLPFDLPAD